MCVYYYVMRNVRLITLAIVAVAFLAPVATAGPSFELFADKTRDNFMVGHATFNSNEPGKVRLEVYYQVYNSALNFYRRSNGLVADYELAVYVYGDKDMLVDSYRKSDRVRVTSESKAKSNNDYRTNQLAFELPPGKYKVKLILADPNSDKVQEREFKIKPKYLNDQKPKLSDIQLVQAAAAAGSDTTKFDKGGFTLVPSVSNRYGTQDALKLMYYFEVYRGESDLDSIRVETKLRHATKGMLYRDSLTSEMTDGVLRQFREISVEELRPGEFKLEIFLRGRRGRELDKKTKYFELVWSEHASLKHDYGSLVSQLSMISLPKDIEQLKNQETLDDRLRAFNTFWDIRDPTPGTPENEAKSEFYRRVRIANQNFSYLRTNGWKTDRGRVYIIYGEPDQIEDYPFVPNQLPYQEWHYYRDARYRKFVFIDETGDGDFRLIYPYDGLGMEPEFYR